MAVAGENMPEYLQIEVEQLVGELKLSVTCSLSAPWTLLFGPSGAGKTSLLRLIAGLARPDRGQVTLHGRTLVDTEQKIWIPPGQRAIGFLAQRQGLFPHLTVAANISFGIADASQRNRSERAAEIMDLLRMRHLAERMPAKLSGGEKQRVALARALAPEPRFMLLDEPFTGMDTGLKSQLLEELSAWLSARGIPALYVSHDVTEAFRGSVEVLLIKNGRITGQGPATVVLADQRDILLTQLSQADVSMRNQGRL
jgi:molybdate transport system ATP-binding protein